MLLKAVSDEAQSYLNNLDTHGLKHFLRIQYKMYIQKCRLVLQLTQEVDPYRSTHNSVGVLT